MQGVSSPAARASRRVLAGAGLLALAGCGTLVDDVQYDSRAEQRPGTWVRRLQDEIRELTAAYDDMMRHASSSQIRRLPRISSELNQLSDAAASMRDDLTWKRGNFVQHLAKAEAVASSIDNQVSGAPVTRAVRSHWWDTGYALGHVREFYRALGPARLYEVEEDPRGKVTLASKTPADDYDASFEVDQARRGYQQMVGAWKNAPIRRSKEAWTAELDRELAALSDPVSALQRVDTGKREAVIGAAEGLRDRIERMRPLFEAHEAELPREFREGWAKLTSWIWHVDKRPR